MTSRKKKSQGNDVRLAASRGILCLLRCRDEFDPDHLNELLKVMICKHSEAERGGSGYKKRQHCLLISTGVEADPEAKVTFEHVVPKAVVVDFLLSLAPEALSLERVEWLMSRLTVGCLVTAAEDSRIRKAGLQSVMPAGWSAATNNPWDRYAQVGLQVIFRPGSDVLPGNHPSLATEAGVIQKEG